MGEFSVQPSKNTGYVKSALRLSNLFSIDELEKRKDIDLLEVSLDEGSKCRNENECLGKIRLDSKFNKRKFHHLQN